MKLFFKIIGYTLATFVGLVVIAFLALQFISDEQYKKWIAGAAESATGRTLAINGEFNVQIGTKIGIQAHDISFANADWGSRKDMVSVDRLFVQLRLIPLLKGVLDVTAELDGPDILLEKNGDGKANWVFAAPGTQPEPPAEAEQKGEEGSFPLPLKPYIRNFQIANLIFAFNDAVQGKNIEAAAETLRLYVDGTDIPMSLKATFQGAPVELDGSLGNIEAWYGNQKTQIALKGRLNEAHLGIEGSAGPMLPSPNAELDLTLAADNVETFSDFVAFTGISLPSLQGLDASLTLAAEEGHLATKNADINLNDPRLLIAAKGNVADLKNMSGIEVTAEISSESTAELMQELKLEIPYSLPQTMNLKASVSGNLSQLSVKGLEFIVKDQGLDINLTGSLEDLFKIGKGEADLNISLDSTAIIGGYLGQELPEFGPFAASARVSSAEKTIQLESLLVELKDPAVSAKISGSAQSIGRSADGKFDMRGIEIKASAWSEQLREMVTKFGVEVPGTLPDSSPQQTLKFKADVSGDLDKLSVQGLELIVKDQGLDINLIGSLEDPFGSGKGEADLNFSLDSTSIIGSYIGQELPEFGPFAASARVSSAEKSIQLESLLVELKDPAVSARISGSAQSMGRSADGKFDMQGIEIQADAGLTQLQDIVARLGVEIPVALPDSFDLQLSSSGNLNTLALTDLQATAKDEGLEVNLSGTMDNVLKLSGITAHLDAAVDDTAYLSKYAGFDLPALGSLQLAGKVLSAGETYRLENLEAALDGEAAKVKITGAVQDLLALAKVGASTENYGKAGIEASATAEVASIADLLKLANIEIAEIGALKLNGRLASAASSLRLENLEVGLDGELAKVQVTGAVQDLLALTRVGENPENYGKAGIEASATAEAASLANLLKLANIEISEIGALKLDGRLASAAGSLKLDSLNASLVSDGFNTKAQATMADVIGLTGLTAVIDGDLKSLSSLSGLAQKQLPETGPWVVHIQAEANDLAQRQMTFSASLEGEGIKADIDANLPDVKAPQTFQTQLAVEVNSIARLGELLGKPVAEDKSLRLTGRATGEPGVYHLDDLLLQAEGAEIRANLAYLAPPQGNVERKNLSGKVTIDNFDFAPLLAPKEKEAEIEKEETETPVEEQDTEQNQEEKKEEETQAKGKKVFSSEPLSVGALQEYDVDLQIDATNVKLREDVTLDGELVVKLDNGLLTLDPLQLKQGAGGSGSGKITLDASAPVARLNVELDFKDFASPRFGGLFDIIADLDGAGQSVAELMGNLNGQFVASAKDVELNRSYMSQFGAGLLKQLNPLDSDKTVLECAVVQFDITDGIADFEKKIAAQTTEVTWLGGGMINLKTEELDLGISPKARGALSSLTNIDLASLVHIGGTLAEPKIGLDVVDVAKKYAQYTAFFATGGLSFLAQKVVETTQANMNQCERILSDLEEQK